MAIMSSIKNAVSKAVSTVKSAFSSAGSSSQGASVASAPKTVSPTSSGKNYTPYQGSYAQTTGYGTKTPQVITAYSPTGAPYSTLNTKNYTPASTSYAKNVGYSPSSQLYSTGSIGSNYSASDFGSGANSFSTPATVSPSLNAGTSAYIGASGTSAGGLGYTTSAPTGSSIKPSGNLDTTEPKKSKIEDTYDQSTKDLMDLMSQLTGKPAESARLQQEAGIPQLQSDLRDLQAKQMAQQAQFLAQTQDIQNKPIAMEFIAGQQGEVQRRYGIDSLLTGALIQSKQGQLQTAQDMVDKALSIKYDTITQRIAMQKEIVDLNYKNLTREDKKIADARSEQLALQKATTEYDRDLRKSLVNNIYSGMKDGTIENDTGNSMIKSILDDNTKLSDIYKNMGVTGAGNPGLINGFDITRYATDPNHEININAIYNANSYIKDANTAQQAINKNAKGSPITGQMIINSANKYNVDPALMFSLMLNDSRLGTEGKAVKTRNPGNVGNFDNGATRTYNSWAGGVDAVGEWLSKNRAKALYNGEYQDTLDNIVTFEPQKSQKTVLNNMKKQIADGNYQAVYTQIGNSVSKGLTGENKTRYDSARIDMRILSNFRNTLQEFEAAGGDTGFLKGSVEKIARKFGQLKADPRFTELAVQMEREFQAYRNQMTGAAFSPGESREYDAVNPSGKKSFALNYAVINGAYNQLQNRVYSVEESLAGDGVKGIRERALGVDPLLQNMSMAQTGKYTTDSNISNSDFFNNLFR